MEFDAHVKIVFITFLLLLLKNSKIILIIFHFIVIIEILNYILIAFHFIVIIEILNYHFHHFFIYGLNLKFL
jgi:hypothetical protein